MQTPAVLFQHCVVVDAAVGGGDAVVAAADVAAAVDDVAVAVVVAAAAVAVVVVDAAAESLLSIFSPLRFVAVPEARSRSEGRSPSRTRPSPCTPA